MISMGNLATGRLVHPNLTEEQVVMGNLATGSLVDPDLTEEHAVIGNSLVNDLIQEQAVALAYGFLESPSTYIMHSTRKKPNLKKFRPTTLYKEIKALCNLPATSNKPNECWSLAHGLMRRENGLTGGRTGSFTANQQRRIANRFIPNKKVECLMSLECKVFVCKYNKDGSKLVTASQDTIVRIFDSSKGTYQRIRRAKMRDVNWSILDVDISPCGRYFTYSTWTKYFNVLSMEEGSTEFVPFTRNARGMFSVRFSPCGKTIIGGCSNSAIYTCDRETGSVHMIRTLDQFPEDINAISYLNDQDSNLIISGCNNGLIKLWDLRCSVSNRRPIKPASTFVGHLDAITYIDPRNDGQYFLTNARDQSIKLWDIRQPTPHSLVQKHSNAPLKEWDHRWGQVPQEYYIPTVVLEGDCSIMTFRGHKVSKTLLRAKFSPKTQTGQRYIYTGCSTGRIIVYDVLTGQIKEAIESHHHVVRDVDWHPIRPEIVSASWDGNANLNGYHRIPNLDPIYPKKRKLRRSRRIRNRMAHEDDESDNEYDNANEDEISTW